MCRVVPTAHRQVNMQACQHMIRLELQIMVGLLMQPNSPVQAARTSLVVFSHGSLSKSCWKSVVWSTCAHPDMAPIRAMLGLQWAGRSQHDHFLILGNRNQDPSRPIAQQDQTLIGEYNLRMCMLGTASMPTWAACSGSLSPARDMMYCFSSRLLSYSRIFLRAMMSETANTRLWGYEHTLRVSATT